jgi:hypothetical protein
MPASAPASADRRNVGRIDHVILIYRTRESQEAARQKFSALLGIDDWDEVGEAAEGIYIFISWTSGIELVCPTREVPAFERHLSTRGEGFYAMVFGVADMKAAIERIEAFGGRAPYALPPPPASVMDKFDVVREVVVGDVGGIRLMLGEFKPKV